MDVYHLRCFHAVAQHLSFTRAARELSLEPSPLSRRIRDLERDLGVQLFHRTSREVWLTAEGQRLMPLAKDILERFDSVRPHILATNRTSISVGHQRSTPEYLLARVRELMKDLASNLQLEMTVGRYSELADAVLREKLDLTLQFFLDAPSSPELDFAPLEYFDLAIAVSEAERHRFGDSVQPADLATERVLLTYFGDTVTTQLREVFGSAGVRSVANASDSWELALEVQAGRAVALTVDSPRAPFTQMLSKYRISILPLEGLDVVALTGLVWSRNRALQDSLLAQVTHGLKLTALIPREDPQKAGL